MSAEAKLREDICLHARSIYDRGLTHGSSGNISARLDDGSLFVTPTGATLGRLDPAGLAHLAPDGRHLGGPEPTKEVPLHLAFYATRARTGAVVHLHSTHATALSILEDVDPEDALPPLTAYSIMLLGRVRLLPYFRPGDPAMGVAVRELEGRFAAVLLANHGPVVAGATLEKAVFAMEELEATARLDLLTRGLARRPLTPEEIAGLTSSSDPENAR
ncbi:MAG: 3-oxo-tetronate 4-phosphate decarboxylase [Pseudomonadota bacterium]